MRLKLYRGWWYAVWREEGQTKRRALRTQDRDAANRALADYQRHLASPTGTIGSIYAAYLVDKGTERATWAWNALSRRSGRFGRTKSPGPSAGLIPLEGGATAWVTGRSTLS